MTQPHCAQYSHVWLFEGAEPGDIVDIIEKRYGGLIGPIEEGDDAPRERPKKARTK
jgi:hypothetical protein